MNDQTAPTNPAGQNQNPQPQQNSQPQQAGAPQNNSSNSGSDSGQSSSGSASGSAMDFSYPSAGSQSSSPQNPNSQGPDSQNPQQQSTASPLQSMPGSSSPSSSAGQPTQPQSQPASQSQPTQSQPASQPQQAKPQSQQSTQKQGSSDESSISDLAKKLSSWKKDFLGGDDKGGDNSKDKKDESAKPPADKSAAGKSGTNKSGANDQNNGNKNDNDEDEKQKPQLDPSKDLKKNSSDGDKKPTSSPPSSSSPTNSAKLSTPQSAASPPASSAQSAGGLPPVQTVKPVQSDGKSGPGAGSNVPGGGPTIVKPNTDSDSGAAPDKDAQTGKSSQPASQMIKPKISGQQGQNPGQPQSTTKPDSKPQSQPQQSSPPQPVTPTQPTGTQPTGAQPAGTQPASTQKATSKSGKFPHKIDQLLQMVIDKKASDLHVTAGYPAMLRIDGALEKIDDNLITEEVSKDLILPVLPENKQELLEVNREVDLAYSYEDKARFRINAYYERGRMAAAFRLIPSKIRTIEELKLPTSYHQIAKLPQGFVLVTGPTGHGKSTTLAAILNEINLNQPKHIITIEDPIEYVYPPGTALVDQREMHEDTHSWEIALRSAMRQDPDVVLVGEMRDYETISAAITLAETGHLVLATLHTNNASQTIDRIIDVFPEHQQEQIRTQLANIIEAVISQRLIPITGGGRRAVSEIMFATSAVKNLIREGKTYQIDNVIRTSMDVGMKSLEQSLVDLVREGVITTEDAENAAVYPEEITRLLK